MITDPEIKMFLKKDGAKLRRLRISCKMTQKKLAESSGLVQHQISEMENGTKEYTVISLYRYLKGLRLSGS